MKAYAVCILVIYTTVLQCIWIQSVYTSESWYNKYICIFNIHNYIIRKRGIKYAKCEWEMRISDKIEICVQYW